MPNFGQPTKYDITVHIDFPALDHLVTFLESNLQGKIDAVTKRVIDNTAKVKAAVDEFTPKP